MIHYVDTSFIGLILLDQEGADDAEALIREASSNTFLVSSVLLRVELTRLARRTQMPLSSVTAALEEIGLVEISSDVIASACALTSHLKSLDAIHLATALMLESPLSPVTVLTHDTRLAEAARAHGLKVTDPV